MPSTDKKQLLISLHDVGPAFKSEVEFLVARLTERLGGARFAMLVVPDHWGAHRLDRDRPFAARLRRWSEEGVEMFLHGWSHRDDTEHSGFAEFKAHHMTAGEGEFLGLSAEEAGRRMAAGKALLEDIIGRSVAGFVAPAWLYGPGATDALARSGFPLAEDHLRVWRPDTGATVARGPVITWANRSQMRTASSLAFAALARTALQALQTVRIAVHPGDVAKESILASIDRTIAAFASRRTVGRYSSLLA